MELKYALQVAGKALQNRRIARRLVDWAGRRATAPFRVLPDVLIVGAMKAGTSSLYAYLEQHPNFAPAWEKEVHYFDHQFDRSLYWYRSHFATRREVRRIERITGERVVTWEASPYYLFHRAASRRIVNTIPNVKIIILLRDPVKRAYSHYNHACRRGQEELSFERAIEEETARLSSAQPGDDRYRWNSYVSRGLYARQIARYLKHFDRRQLLILKSEGLFFETQRTYDRVLDFLGLCSYSLETIKPRNKASYDRSQVPAENQLRERFRPYNEKLYDLIGERMDW